MSEAQCDKLKLCLCQAQQSVGVIVNDDRMLGILARHGDLRQRAIKSALANKQELNECMSAAIQRDIDSENGKLK